MADSDHDGKITKIEWLVMWENYKKELVEQYGEDEDFLKDFHKLKCHQNNIELHKFGKPLEEGEERESENDVGDDDKFLYKKYTILPPWLYDYLVFRCVLDILYW